MRVDPEEVFAVIQCITIQSKLVGANNFFDKATQQRTLGTFDF
jgi:hypothetical protein